MDDAVTVAVDSRRDDPGDDEDDCSDDAESEAGEVPVPEPRRFSL